ncbi:cilia- and flagella-associated protein 184 [Aegotheles albertisi]
MNGCDWLTRIRLPLSRPIGEVTPSDPVPEWSPEARGAAQPVTEERRGRTGPGPVARATGEAGSGAAMEAAAGGPGELSPAAPGEPPGPEVLDGPGEPAETRPEETPGPDEPEPPEPEEPGLKEPEPPEPEEPRLKEPEPPGPEERSEPEVAAGPSGRSVPGPPVAAPVAGGAGAEEAGGRHGAAGEAPPAERAEEPPATLAPAAPGGAERRSGEVAVAAEDEERAALLEQHRGLAGERERLRQASARLQLRLGQLPRPRAGAGGPELYTQHLLRLRELREQRDRAAAACREREEARRRGGEERQARAEAAWAAFQAREKEVAVPSAGRRPGRREAAAAAVERAQARAREAEQRLREVRVENIKLKREIQNLEAIWKARGERADTQHFMDFEHMNKENQKHSKKIEDLSDEILKLKQKVANTVHVLAQFREKLEFVEAENEGRKAELMDIEAVLSQQRDILTKTKRARDRLQRNNLELQQKHGLLGNEILLQDFEEKVDTTELLTQRLETLKRRHAGVIITRRAIQKKISQFLFPR